MRVQNITAGGDSGGGDKGEVGDLAEVGELEKREGRRGLLLWGEWECWGEKGSLLLDGKKSSSSEAAVRKRQGAGSQASRKGGGVYGVRTVLATRKRQRRAKRVGVVRRLPK